MEKVSPSDSEPDRPGGTATLGDRPVGRIGFGAMQLPGPGVWGPPRDPAMAVQVLRKAVELGVNHIDTAQFYGRGVANELIRAALHPYPDDLVLVSKVGAARDAEGRFVEAQRPEHLRAGVEENLATLDVERIDVVNLRLLPQGQAGDAILDDQLAEMVALREEGKIGAIGVSNATADQLRRALPVGLVCVQNRYSLLDRAGESVLDLCREHNLAWVPYFPLGSAFAHLAKVTEHPVVIDAANRLRATPAQVGLAWLLAHDPRTLLIPGTSSVDHVAQNVATRHVKLDPETMAVLDGLAPPPGS